MEFIYNYALLPKNQRLLKDINSAASRLFDKLKVLNIDTLDISDYNKVYFGEHLSSLTNSLQKYSYILSWALAKFDSPIDRFVLLDYGGGSGILSLLAKELNIGTVIYNDIYDVSCKDANTIGETIGNKADYYIHGDIDAIINFLKTNSVSCNAIVSYDVIEHIYDIEGFLKKLKKLNTLSKEQLIVFMSSGANISNPLIKKSLEKIQFETEYKDREKRFGFKERDSPRAYFDIRKEIIISHYLEFNEKLDEKEIENLAKSTRGMIEPDIKTSIEDYWKTGIYPQKLSHPTNTCDPYTGNWCEHLMEPYHLKNILSKAGFKVEILCGYYGRPKNIIKRLILTSLNLTIYLLRRRGIIIAPFFSIYGIRETGIDELNIKDLEQ